MAENRKDNEARFYYFTKGQLALVTTGFLLTSILVFLMGMVVGQGVEERKLLKQEEPLVKVPIQPQAAAAKPSEGEAGKEDQLTFYDTLSKGGGAAPAKEAPEKSAKIKSSAETEPPVKEVKTAKAQAPEPPPAAKEVKTAKATAPEAPSASKEKVDKPPEKVEVAAKTEDKGDAPRDWTVQLNAYPDERSAQRLADRLKQKGYDAYVVTKNLNGHDWYRVRVGHFPTRTQAKEYLDQIQTKEPKENFTKAIAVSK